jgi:hypothetical protein
MGYKDASDVVKELKRKIRRWANYFKIGAVTKSYKHLSHYIIDRYRHFLGRKHKWKTKGYKGSPDQNLYKESELIDIF